MNNEMFRKVSIDKLKSPEELDKLIQINKPLSWVVLITIGLLLLLFISWCFWGQIPTNLPVTGIITKPQGIFDVVSLSNGVIEKVLIKRGDEINKGAIIAQVRQKEMDDKIQASKEKIALLKQQYLSAVINKNRNQTSQIQLQLLEEESLLKILEDSYQESVYIKSPYSGTVLELDAEEGMLIHKGSSIARIEIFDKDLQAIVYTSAQNGKKIKVGMSAKIIPINIDQDEGIFVHAKIITVSPFPMSSEAIYRKFQQPDLVKEIMKNGPPIEIRIELLKDPNQPNTYQWSNKKAKKIKIYSGTFCFGTIVLKEQKPIDLIFSKFNAEE